MKKRILAFGMAAVLVVGSAMSAFAAESTEVDLTDGLVAYYSFDDTLENAISGNSASLHGGAGDTWNADTTGTATYATGVSGNAYSFLGNSDTASGEGLMLDVTATSAYTFSYWVNATAVTSATSQVFIAQSVDDAESTMNGLNIADNWFGTTYPTVRIWSDGGYFDATYLDYWTPSGDAAEFVGTWKYITLTCDGTNLALYVDGVSVATGTTASDFSGESIFLGINWWDASFYGLMDEFAVYSRALSADEVSALYSENGVPYSVTQTQSEIGMAVDDTRSISSYITTTPSTLATTVTYAVEQDGDIISIDAETGVITALAKGTATVIATYTAYGSTYVYTFTVEVSEPNSIEAVSFGVSSVDLSVGGTMQLAASYTAEKNTTITDEYTATFASSDTSVVTVDATGLVTAVGAGTANVTLTVTGTNHDGEAYTYTATVAVTVTEAETVEATTTEESTETTTAESSTTASTASDTDATNTDPTTTTTTSTTPSTADTSVWSYIVLLAGAALAVVVIARKKVTE